MNFEELINKLNGLNTVNNSNEINSIIDSINISPDNFGEWIDSVFSEKVDSFDMNKLPYLIDGLYKTNDKFKFMLGCMLIESTCDKLGFITNLESYPLFVAKFETLINTLVTVYDRVDNGIANCMALIIINNDPKFEHFNTELKNNLIEATKRKLNDIYNYLENNLKSNTVDSSVYYDLEVIVDLSCYLNNNEISELIDKIDKLGNNDIADIFIMKYKIINNMSISNEKVDLLKNSQDKLWLLYSVMEQLGVNDKYLSDITQEQIAKSDMIKWLSYPTELGSAPDRIELLGDFICEDMKCFAYKFSKDNFKISGDLLGVSGGFPLDKTTSNACGYTFSKFETLSDDWKNQAFELVKFISDCFKNKDKND